MMPSPSVCVCKLPVDVKPHADGTGGRAFGNYVVQGKKDFAGRPAFKQHPPLDGGALQSVRKFVRGDSGVELSKETEIPDVHAQERHVGFCTAHRGVQHGPVAAEREHAVTAAGQRVLRSGMDKLESVLERERFEQEFAHGMFRERRLRKYSYFHNPNPIYNYTMPRRQIQAKKRMLNIILNFFGFYKLIGAKYTKFQQNIRNLRINIRLPDRDAAFRA